MAEFTLTRPTGRFEHMVRWWELRVAGVNRFALLAPYGERAADQWIVYGMRDGLVGEYVHSERVGFLSAQLIALELLTTQK